MIAQCNYIPDAIWVRETENGLTKITLRRNFTEEMNVEGDKYYTFEEVDIVIPYREDIVAFIEENFGNLFDLGLQQTEDSLQHESKILHTQQLIQTGKLAENMQLIGQQITNILLEVM